MIFNLIFYMIAMSSFYANKIGDHNIFYVGIVFTLIVWIGLIVHFKTGKVIKVDEHLEEKKSEEGDKLTEGLT